MSRTLLDTLDPTNRILKRAQYEAFEFELLDGDVQVRNASYRDPTSHEYRVTIDDGVPTACECPADEHSDGPCKHRVAVAIRPRVLDIAVKMRLVADGGSTSPNAVRANRLDETESKQCGCDDLPDDFPCWECVRTGRRELPE